MAGNQFHSSTSSKIHSSRLCSHPSYGSSCLDRSSNSPVSLVFYNLVHCHTTSLSLAEFRFLTWSSWPAEGIVFWALSKTWINSIGWVKQKTSLLEKHLIKLVSPSPAERCLLDVVSLEQSARAMKLHEHPAVRDLCGGAAIGHLASQGDEHRYQLITPHYSAKIKDCSFSFGGILAQTQRMINKEEIRHGEVPLLFSLRRSFIRRILIFRFDKRRWTAVERLRRVYSIEYCATHRNPCASSDSILRCDEQTTVETHTGTRTECDSRLD